mmetsp:Transcript_21203/g.55295  ORF Transcript_21203/g.55295 Transcript_21203/m.55295 type:complete len:347 (+) Transcript_21203:265-1305(+)
MVSAQLQIVLVFVALALGASFWRLGRNNVHGDHRLGATVGSHPDSLHRLRAVLRDLPPPHRAVDCSAHPASNSGRHTGQPIDGHVVCARALGPRQPLHRSGVPLESCKLALPHPLAPNHILEGPLDCGGELLLLHRKKRHKVVDAVLVDEERFFGVQRILEYLDEFFVPDCASRAALSPQVFEHVGDVVRAKIGRHDEGGAPEVHHAVLFIGDRLLKVEDVEKVIQCVPREKLHLVEHDERLAASVDLVSDLPTHLGPKLLGAAVSEVDSGENQGIRSPQDDRGIPAHLQSGLDRIPLLQTRFKHPVRQPIRHHGLAHPRRADKQHHQRLLWSALIQVARHNIRNE